MKTITGTAQNDIADSTTFPEDGVDFETAASLEGTAQTAANNDRTLKARMDPLADIAALKGINTTGWGAIVTSRAVKNFGVYHWDSASAAAEALPNVVAPTTGSGRWFLMAPMRVDVILASGSWTCPAGVTEIEIEGCGGGGGGGAGTPANTDNTRSANGGGGGGGAVGTRRRVAVVPGTVYTTTIGAGGVAGTTGSDFGNGQDGGDSTFGALATFPGAMGGGSSTGTPSNAAAVTFGGMPVKGPSLWKARSGSFHQFGMYPTPGMGGPGQNNLGSGITGQAGNPSINGFAAGAGGANGADSGAFRGGGGGGGGGGGAYGAGGAAGAGGAGNGAGTGANGSAGTSASANTGGGGGGAGGPGQGSAAGGTPQNGGTGGSGRMIVTYYGAQAAIT